jgi:hypothetical protein
MAEIGWSGILIAGIFIADVIVFVGLVREDWREHRARHRRHRRLTAAAGLR